MSSRAEQKAEAREAGLAADAAVSAQATRRRRLILFGVTLAVAAVVFAGVALLSSGGDDGGGTADQVTLFDGIPQDGAWLGKAGAPVTVEEFADLQCPFCAAASKEQLPAVVKDFVRPGDVRMRLRLLAFIGDDSVKGARAAWRAADENRMWQFAEAWYADQGPENSGYATDDFISGIADKAGASDVLSGGDAAAISKQLSEDRSAASAAQIDSTPTFLVKGADGKTQTVAADGLAKAIRDARAASGQS